MDIKLQIAPDSITVADSLYKRKFLIDNLLV